MQYIISNCKHLKYAEFVTTHIDLGYIHLSSIAEGDLQEVAGTT
jgi:hypothetical protein